MNCPVCNTAAELKVFSSFQYHYCPVCKDDIATLPKPGVRTTTVILKPEKEEVATLNILSAGDDCPHDDTQEFLLPFMGYM